MMTNDEVNKLLVDALSLEALKKEYLQLKESHEDLNVKMLILKAKIRELTLKQ